PCHPLGGRRPKHGLHRTARFPSHKGDQSAAGGGENARRGPCKPWRAGQFLPTVSLARTILHRAPMVKEAMRPLAVTVAVVLICALGVAPTQAQRTKGRATTPTEVPHSTAKELRRQQPGAKESVEADVSARNVAVRADFNGVEIVVFGAVDNSQ